MRITCTRATRISGRPVIPALFTTALMVLASCASSDTVATSVDAGPTQPRMASYACADGGQIRIENRGTSVRVVGEDGEGVDLPAAPPGQHSRYGEGVDALVIDGREALLMRSGRTPLSCSR